LKERENNPCYLLLEKVINAMEAADYNYRPLSKYMRDFEKCVEEQKKEGSKSKPGTMFYLNQYLDQQKHKTK